jgi:uncharacterized membrane protein HdeD (DUF308 family)
MGIKNIHILLISASSLVSLLFGYWALNHNYTGLGYVSLGLGIALIVYGIQFIKKAKDLK